jgi:hypothetical protein
MPAAQGSVARDGEGGFYVVHAERVQENGSTAPRERWLKDW